MACSNLPLHLGTPTRELCQAWHVGWEMQGAGKSLLGGVFTAHEPGKLDVLLCFPH